MNLKQFKTQLNQEKKKAANRNSLAIILVIGLIIFLFVIIGIAVSGSDNTSNNATPTQTANTPEAIADKCLSSWDGNSDDLEALVRADLNDPDSMQTDETKYNVKQLFDVNDDDVKEIFINMQYRATNAFGGVIRQTATAYIDKNCSIVEYYHL